MSCKHQWTIDKKGAASCAKCGTAGVIRPLHKCKRCGYSWEPRMKDPRQCPHCKTAYWDTERE